MGIVQFLFLSAIILVYVVIIGGLIGRAVARNANEMKRHSGPSQEEILI